ncbi:MAG: sporulation integral membrane protein YtvI [Bacillota bacterium]
MDTEFLNHLPGKITGKRTLFLAGIFLLIVILLRLFIFTLTPFFLALVIAILIDKPVNLLAKKLPRFIAVFLVLILLFVLMSVVVIFVFTSLISELVYLTSFLPEYREQIIETINEGLQIYQDFFEPLPVEILDIIDNNLIQRGESLISSTVSNIIEGTVNFTINIPGLIIFFIFMAVTCFFLSKDKKKIIDYIKLKLDISDTLQSNIINDVLSYLRVQLLILTNTTILTGITFHWLDFPYAIILALTSGVLDLIPVIGPGAILWPLIIYNLFFNLKTALVLLVLYILISGIRPIIESKILGNNIGLHPIILLFGLYVGLIYLGFQGVVLAPVSMIIFKALLNNDVI